MCDSAVITIQNSRRTGKLHIELDSQCAKTGIGKSLCVTAWMNIKATDAEDYSLISHHLVLGSVDLGGKHSIRDRRRKIRTHVLSKSCQYHCARCRY